MFATYLIGKNRLPCPNARPILFFWQWLKGAPGGRPLEFKAAAKSARVSRVIAYRWVKLLRECDVDESGLPDELMFFRPRGRPPRKRFAVGVEYTRLKGDLGREPTAAELGEAAGVTNRYARSLLPYIRKPLLPGTQAKDLPAGRSE
jgi:hypothetical protein